MCCHGSWGWRMAANCFEDGSTWVGLAVCRAQERNIAKFSPMQQLSKLILHSTSASDMICHNHPYHTVKKLNGCEFGKLQPIHPQWSHDHTVCVLGRVYVCLKVCMKLSVTFEWKLK